MAKCRSNDNNNNNNNSINQNPSVASPRRRSNMTAHSRQRNKRRVRPGTRAIQVCTALLSGCTQTSVFIFIFFETTYRKFGATKGLHICFYPNRLLLD
jgi:hypothetical protein